MRRWGWLVGAALMLTACSSPPEKPAGGGAGQAAAAAGVASVAIPAEATKWRATLIREVRYSWGLWMNPAPWFAQVHAESLWKSGARSRFASGMTQFTPGTAKDMQAGSSRLKELCANAGGCPLDPAWALRAMVIYDRDLWAGLIAFPAADERLAATLVAYNGGPGWVEKERLRCYDNRSSTEPCDAGRWFGHVERYCLRGPAACAESRHYPRVILHTWAPLYDAWLLGGRP